jgi:hypothetical protein
MGGKIMFKVPQSMPNDPDDFEEVASQILDELDFACKKYPKMPSSIFPALSLISEELGEAHQAALDVTFKDAKVESVIAELAQTAAMCMRAMKALKDIKANG